MEIINTYPLVSFVVLTYNQEEFVREAVLSAFSQKYSPLEIIISDDASSDNTVNIAKKMISEYSGEHQIILNVNSKNLGIGAHVNQVFSRARGEMILLAGGDDISHPQRTTRVVQRWLDSGKGAKAIYCGARHMHPDGSYYGHIETELERGNLSPEHLMTYKHFKRSLAIGACGAYAADVMRYFGNLDSNLSIEDIPLLVRASMLDGIEYIDEDLVDYRVGVSVWRSRAKKNDPFEKRRERRLFYTKSRLDVSLQLLHDALRRNNTSYIKSAIEGYLIHDFVYQCCCQQKMNLQRYFGVALITKNWLYMLLAALMDGNPRIHRLLYQLKHRLLAFKNMIDKRNLS